MKHFIKVFCILFLTLHLNYCTEKETPTEPPPLYDEDGLLSDAGLMTEEDPNAPTENAYWVNWIKMNNIPIRSLSAEIFTDLETLIPLLENKKFIQLGESGHGVAEFNKAKVRLIKFLHQELGFDVIAFESSIFECFYANQNVSTFDDLEIMHHSIFGVWHTEEVRELFTYIKNSAQTAHPLILAGFDTQFSAYMGYINRPAFFKRIISKIDPVYADQIYALDSEFTQNWYEADYLESNQDTLMTYFNNLVDFFDNHMIEFTALYQDSFQIPLIARQTAWSMPRFIKQIIFNNKQNYFSAMETRDKGMADNLEYLINKIFPEKKIMVWAHNFHIRHDNSAVPNYAGLKTMGTYIAQNHRNDLYTIGLYMYRGKAAWNNRDVYKIEPAKSGSLESIFYRARKKYCYVDMANEEQDEGNSWMFRSIYSKSWGTTDLKMVLKDQYDGILFIDTVSPPDYLYYYSKNIILKSFVDYIP